MPWNWQQPDWPNFTWDAVRLHQAEQRFLIGSGEFSGILKHLTAEDRERLTADAISTEALTTSEIEGEILDRASVLSSIRRQLGLTAERRTAKPAEQGIAEMMVDLFRSFAAPLSIEMLFAWHRMLMSGRSGLAIGTFRAGDEPMQVVSGALYAPQIHFAAPPSAQVPEEMEGFVRWFNRTAPDGESPLPALTRAGIAHLYFESIHPFEDGNGRIGRAISEKAFSQSQGQPGLTALAATILIRRKDYYAHLEAANKNNELTAWLAWFAGIALEAQQRTAVRLEFAINQTRFLDGLRGQLNDRQLKVLLRMLREGPEGFKGGLSAGNYGTITGTSPATATRDLADLVAKDALRRSGEHRYARYFLPIGLRSVPQVTIDEGGRLQPLESTQP